MEAEKIQRVWHHGAKNPRKGPTQQDGQSNGGQQAIDGEET